jgi:alpha-beta hydrolase superfamily lysophospholipase
VTVSSSPTTSRWSPTSTSWWARSRSATALDAELKTIYAGPKLADLPALWLHGGEDQLVPLAETRAGIEALAFDRLQEVIYGGARHEVFNEINKDEVLGATADFIDAVTG